MAIETKIDLKTAVLIQLKPGRNNAIPGRLLAQRLGFKDDRPIRRAIRELIADGHPIAAAVSPPKGYFFVSNWEEVKDYNHAMTSRLREDAQRLRQFNHSASLYLKEAMQGILL